MKIRELLSWLQRQFSLRSLRWWQWLVLLVIGVWTLARTWLPGFIQRQVVTNLTALTTAQVTLGDVDLNLLRGRLELQQLSFTLAGEEHPALAIRDLAVNIRLRSLLRRIIDVEDLTLTGLQIEAVQEPNGQLNLSRLFRPTPPDQPQTEPSDLPTLTIGEIEVVESSISYQDRTRQGEPRFEFAITDLTTEKIDLQSRGLAAPVAMHLKGTLNQSPLQGKVEILWQREHTSVDANIGLQQLALTAIEPYLQDALAFQKLSGHLGAQLHYRFQTGGKAPPAHALAGTVTLENLQVDDPFSQKTALSLPKGKVEIETIDLTRQDIRVTSVELQDLKVWVLQTPTGMNLASLVRTAKQEQASTASPWRFALKTVKWTGGELQYQDSTWPETETLVVSLEELALQNLGSEATELPFRLRTRLGEGTLAGDGTLQLSPFTMQGQFQPVGIDVAVFRPFLAVRLPGKSLQGKVSGSVHAALNPQSPEGSIRFDGTLETTQFLLEGMPEAGSSISWESGRIEIREGSTATPLALQLQPQLTRLRVQRPAQAGLAIEQVTGTVTLTSPLGTEGQPPPPLRVSGSLATTQLTLTGIPEAASGLTWESARIDIGNGSTLAPLALEVSTQLVQVALQRLPQGDVAIEKASATLRLAQEERPQQEQWLRVQGPVDLTGFVLTQGPEKKILLGCYHATAKIAEGSRLVPFDVRVPDVALEYTYAQGMRTLNGQFQLFIPPAQSPEPVSVSPDTAVSSAAAPPTNVPEAEIPPAVPIVIPESSATSPPEAPATASTGGLAIRIDRLSIIGGELYFEDRTVIPTQTVYWQDVRVNVNTLSYPLVFPATFSAFAYNEDGAPVEFQGTTERKGTQTVMRVRGNIQKMSLVRFNSYLEPGLGYRVKKGKVTATWDLVLPGNLVQANMKVTLHNLDLGSKGNASRLEQQVGLPLALIIALLKDLNGDIDLNLPMEGKINEPGFQWGGTIVRAIRDVLIGAVTSPLKLLGAVFKGNEALEDFTFQPLQFVPGTSDMTHDAKAQLGQVSQFLTQRPGVDLRLSGMVGAVDLQTLKDQAILAQLPPAPVPVPAPEQPPSTTEVPTSPPPPLALTPESEVHRFLTQQLHPTDQKTSPVPLSESATTLLEQLRQKTVVAPRAVEQLIGERLQTVTTVLTTQHAVAATRIHAHPEKQRGAGAPEVRYILQTREGESEDKPQSPAPKPTEQQKGEKP
ncbi:MAG: DUF748 domain-containing protein [Deltaproteobacteria bacterium]|nr:DUF748 domain-containing protein [Deltaproteobacteria bacterium]